MKRTIGSNIIVIMIIFACLGYFLSFKIPQKEEIVIVQAKEIIPVEETEIKMPFYDIKLSKDLQKYTWDECQKYDLSYEYVLGVMFLESSFNIEARNGKCIGLMQLNTSKPRNKKESTAQWLARMTEIPKDKFDPYNPYHNIECGVYYLNYLRDKWRGKGVDEDYLFVYIYGSYNYGFQGFIDHLKDGGNLVLKATEKIMQFKYDLEGGKYSEK